MTCLATCPDTTSARYAFALMPITPDEDSVAIFSHLPLLTFRADPAKLKTIWDAVNRVVAPQHDLELGDSQIVLNVPAVAVTNTDSIQRLPEAIAACLARRKDTRLDAPITALMLLFSDNSASRLTAQLVVGESTPSGALHRVLHRAAAVLS
jgi:hypothetical protein